MAVPQLHYDTVPELPLTPSRNNEESPNVHLSPIMLPFERKEAQALKPNMVFTRQWQRNLWGSAKPGRITE